MSFYQKEGGLPPFNSESFRLVDDQPENSFLSFQALQQRNQIRTLEVERLSHSMARDPLHRSDRRVPQHMSRHRRPLSPPQTRPGPIKDRVVPTTRDRPTPNQAEHRILTPTRLAEFQQHLTDVDIPRLTLVCNLNDPVQTQAAKQERQRIQHFLEVMGPWVMPGFNIYRLDFTLDFLFEAINRFGMKRQLRLGITHPIPGKRYDFIRPENLRQVVQRLYSYRQLFDTFRVKPRLDCGFPICRFSDAELGWLHRFPGPVRFGCGPAVDISPDMSVYYCFPLANYQRKSLFEFDSMHQLDEHFLRLRQQIKAEIPGIFDECDGCRYQEDGLCAGGGLCQVLNRLIDEAPVRSPEIEHELAKYRLSP